MKCRLRVKIMCGIVWNYFYGASLLHAISYINADIVYEQRAEFMWAGWFSVYNMSSNLPIDTILCMFRFS